MVPNEEVQEYYSLSKEYLEAALTNLRKKLYDPAMANGIHSLELAIKATLCSVVKEPIKTHNVGGLFGKHFRNKFGDETCRKINLILMKYNLPRYPGEETLKSNVISEDIHFIEDFIKNKIPRVLKM